MGRTDAGPQSNVYLLGKSVYTTYLFPFEATAALLIIAVVGAVVLARRPPGAVIPVGEEAEDPAPDLEDPAHELEGSAHQLEGSAQDVTEGQR